jgi:hypothetical protein
LQYIAAAPEGRELGALDLVIDHLMHDVYRDRDWFSFGISTTESGTVLNEGLSRQKEMFGARGVVFQTLQLEISPSA